MSAIADNATITIGMADFAASDASGKTNVIGDGVAVLGFVPDQGLTNRFALTVKVRLPIGFAGAEFPLEVALLDEAGQLAQLPGPAGIQPFRVAQVVQANSSREVYGQRIVDHVGVSVQAVFDFATGMPLPVSSLLTWRVQVDGDETRQWTYPFAVTGPLPGPVFG
ncbi:hypothetical protein [Curtobacterium sp. MMLR14_010]|uniref:hypothetical protein n=1 Tax=Curtobacterium sp. MMLR14_010 TaxID=1898743 RepID=UPI0011135888|nr:hypothetical protein [Curtobacterium sp. MMLR14_010]